MGLTFAFYLNTIVLFLINGDVRMFLKKGLLVAGLAAFFSNGFAAVVGSATGEFTMNQYYTASMPIYAVQDEISSGGWHEHHFCVCNVSTQTATTHVITMTLTDSAGSGISALAVSSVVSGVETASATTVGGIGSVHSADATVLATRNINDTRSLAGQTMNSGTKYSAASILPSFYLNETGTPSANNFAYVWMGMHQSSGSITASENVGTPATATTPSTLALNFIQAGDVVAAGGVSKAFASWPVAATASSVNNLRGAMGTCNSSTSFDWAADASQCGDHPVGSVVMHVPSEHKGGTYNLYFKLSTVEDTNANGTPGDS